jgi:hypothetical protein
MYIPILYEFWYQKQQLHTPADLPPKHDTNWIKDWMGFKAAINVTEERKMSCSPQVRNRTNSSMFQSAVATLSEIFWHSKA